MTDEYDDPPCTRCGTYRSEHAGMGCTDSFTTEVPPPVIMTIDEYRELHWDSDDDDHDYADAREEDK